MFLDEDGFESWAASREDSWVRFDLYDVGSDHLIECLCLNYLCSPIHKSGKLIIQLLSVDVAQTLFALLAERPNHCKYLPVSICWREEVKCNTFFNDDFEEVVGKVRDFLVDVASDGLLNVGAMHDI